MRLLGRFAHDAEQALQRRRPRGHGFPTLNPFQGAGEVPEIYAYGLRNPSPVREEGILPFGLTVHGFGQDGSGELYALVTNTPANGTGGILYQLAPVPEPGTLAPLGLGLLGLLAWRRIRA